MTTKRATAKSRAEHRTPSPTLPGPKGSTPAAPEQAVAKRKRGAQPGNRNAVRHGANRSLAVDTEWRISLRRRAGYMANMPMFVQR